MQHHHNLDDSPSPNITKTTKNLEDLPTFEFEIQANLKLSGKALSLPMHVLGKLLLPLSASILLGGSSFPPPSSQPPEASPPCLPTQVEQQGDKNL